VQHTQIHAFGKKKKHIACMGKSKIIYESFGSIHFRGIVIYLIM
jgi:hypothetical protein